MKDVKIKRKNYDENFKLGVVEDYYSSGASIRSITRKYGLSCCSLFRSWLKRYSIAEKSLSLPKESESELMAKEKEKRLNSLSCKESKETLEEEVVRLRKALAYSKLRYEALNEVIKISKEEYGIDLLKKAGAKQ
jgi:transposase